MDVLAVVAPVLVFALLIFGLVWRSRRLDANLTKHLAGRGFSTAASPPSLALDGLGFEPWLCLRGPVAPDRVGTIVFGFGRGERRSPDAQSTSMRKFFYTCVVLSATPPLDDAWIARWTGAARAFRQPDGGSS